MKILEKIIGKNGFKYEQVKRDENRAIYAQYTKDGLRLVGYEVFRITVNPSDKFRQSDGERFPSDSDFGNIAWSIANFGDLAGCWLRAEDRYNTNAPA